ncbi:hypothetical protein BDV23DRAFT_177401 [Aspergillus alliaceus]|uniref:Uncharacterized protein n=1 Tax=Petromyces alliaceus TaxID=209559 RepID=A0A5N7BQ71_PETAA|nr:hypothetical protein BDV23DRAFT_177401 [Aspergillus alliaceus]
MVDPEPTFLDGFVEGVQDFLPELTSSRRTETIPIDPAILDSETACEVVCLEITSTTRETRCDGQDGDGRRSSPDPLLNALPSDHHANLSVQWFTIACNRARAAHVPFLVLPSDSTGEEAVVVSELQQLADIASAQQPISALRITQAVDQPNFGLYLDSFHGLTKLWASPFDPDGKLPNADHNLRVSLRDFQDHYPHDNIFYVQLSDSERFDPSFRRPICDISKKLLKSWIADKEFNSWVLLETFDRRMRVAEFQPGTAAQRGRQSWRKLQDVLPAINSNM